MENTAVPANFWKKCSTCKKPILLGQKYFVCSVSTCNGQRTGYVFCSMGCFESHLPGARHRDAGAVEKVALKETASASPEAGQRIMVRPASTPSVATSSAKVPQEVLVIASRFKDYIQARGDMNTSASVMDVISDYLRILADRGIENARADGRKTVMDRDFEFLKKL